MVLRFAAGIFLEDNHGQVTIGGIDYLLDTHLSFAVVMLISAMFPSLVIYFLKDDATRALMIDRRIDDA